MPNLLSSVYDPKFIIILYWARIQYAPSEDTWMEVVIEAYQDITLKIEDEEFRVGFV